MREVASCPSCGYPTGVERAGQITSCAHCGEGMEVISSSGGISGITLPNGLLWFIGGAFLGLLFGPTILSSTTEGARALERKAKRKLAGPNGG